MIETNLDVLYPSGLFNTTDDQWQVETIIETTAHIQSCVENLVSALDARASLLVEFKQFNAAVQDALAMITLAPHSVIGYLTAGRAYSLLGQDASALRIYQQMLQKVPNCDPDYHQFVKAKATEYAMNKRVDFVSQLPFDLVVSNLIPRILHDQPALEIGKQKGYFDVCRTWRQRIALAGGLPFRIGPGALSVHGYRQLSDIAPYLQWLSVSQEEQHEHTPKLIQCAQFTSLQRLDIKESTTRTFSGLLPALRQWSSTLQHLTIEYQRNQLPRRLYRLCDIFDACAELTCLSIMCHDTDLFFVSAQYPKMVKLDLRTTEYRFNKGRMLSLLKAFPHLRSLRLRPSPGSDIFPAIQQYCPRLQHLFLDCVCLHLPDLPKDASKGLRVLCVAQGIGHAEFNGDDLIQFMMQHADTLETFITGPEGFRFSKQLLDQMATFKRLAHIRVFSSIMRRLNLDPFLLWIIQRAPNLESVDAQESNVQESVIQALLKHPHVNHIGFRVPPMSRRNEEEFIQHHLALGDQSNLQRMAIHFINGDISADSWLHMVPRLTQLKAFQLQFVYPNHVKSAMPLILELGESCLSLEQFTLACEERVIDYNLISWIMLHPNIKRLVIDAEALEGDPSAIVHHFDELASLHLRLYTFNWEDIDILRKGRYELTCEQRKYRNFSVDQ